MKVLYVSFILCVSLVGSVKSQDTTSKIASTPDTTAATAPAPAQDNGSSSSNSSWGFKGMVGWGLPSYEGVDQATATSAAAWSAGLFWNWSTGGLVSFAVQPELHYVSESGITTSTVVPDITTTTTSLRLPILAKLELFSRAIIQPSIYVGPSFSYILSAKNEANGTTQDITDPNKFQVGLAFGIDVTFLQIFVLDFRYNTKFTAIKETTINGVTSSVTMNSFRVGLGLRF